MARILLGVSGGIAAYKSLELARLATVAGHGVRVLMTESAEPLRRRRLLRGDRRRAGADRRVRARSAARRPSPATRVPEHDPIGHLELVANCDAYLVAPASANTVAKLAAGIADSMLTTSFLACAAPRLRRPGDERPDVRRRGDPGQPGDAARARRHGDRAGGGAARLARRARPRAPARPGAPAGPGRIGAAGRASGPGTGCSVLVTAGGTREPIDPVRFLGNRSSGRMGLALAARLRAAAPT